MTVILADKEIDRLLKVPKAIVGKEPYVSELRMKRGHSEGQALLQGNDDSDFRVIVRVSTRNPLSFSVILAMRISNTSRWLRLRRYNGKSHWHRNHIEGNSFFDFHIHTATERYQRAGRREDAYAEPTNRYGDHAGALRCLASDTTISGINTRLADQLTLSLEDPS